MSANVLECSIPVIQLNPRIVSIGCDAVRRRAQRQNIEPEYDQFAYCEQSSTVLPMTNSPLEVTFRYGRLLEQAMTL